ncbi:MAG: TolC family protein [Myxococcaceae bacterium]
MRLLGFFCFSFTIWAQDITLEQAESLFLEKNYELLAQQFEYEASKGLVQQEKIWDNPNLQVEESITPLWHSGEANTNLQLSQLLVIAKRSKRVQIAQIDSDISKLNFQDTLRTLKLELRKDFYTLYFLNQNKKFYTEAITALQKTVASAERIFEKRSILLNELMRLKTLLLNLESENLKLAKKISDTKSDFLILLGEDPDTQQDPNPTLDVSKLTQIKFELSLESALQAGLENRPDLKINQALVKQEKINISLQRRSWIPDLTFQANYQQAGNYVNNYVGLSLTFSLPVFDRHQGLSKSARYKLMAKEKREQQSRLLLIQQIKGFYQKAVLSEELFKRTDSTYLANYQKLANDMTQNYQNGNIGIIAFADFYESYRDSMIKISEVQIDRVSAFLELNYAMGIDQLKI